MPFAALEPTLINVVLALALAVVLWLAVRRMQGRTAGGSEARDAGPDGVEAKRGRPAKERPVTSGAEESAGARQPSPAAMQRERQRSTSAPARGAAVAASPRAALAQCKSWGYQLQHLDIRNAAASPYDLLVIDYALDGSEETALKPADLEALKRRPDGSRRQVVAYFSVGEAEDYRWYWQKSWKGAGRPRWLLNENKDWKGNFLVAFWESEWQAILWGGPDAYLDRIMAAGFDGCYLDRCDVYYELIGKRPSAEKDMVAMIERLSAYARARNPAFAIIQQNAEELMEHATVRRAIDAVAKEDLLYGIDHDQRPNPRDDIESADRHLRQAKEAGLPVFVVEYLDDPARIAEAEKQIRRRGFVPYFAPRDLDRLTTPATTA